MATDDNIANDPVDLRRNAEAKAASLPSTDCSPQETDSKRLLHELQVHRIELDMQNEALQRSVQILEEHEFTFVTSSRIPRQVTFVSTWKAVLLRLTMPGYAYMAMIHQKKYLENILCSH
jgi:hypothetical protein